MASKIPVLNGADVVRTFERLGWSVDRQSGSHIILTKFGQQASLAIPNHRPVARGTLRGLIRTAGLTVDQFVDASNL